jgi:hypothetical protein
MLSAPFGRLAIACALTIGPIGPLACKKVASDSAPEGGPSTKPSASAGPSAQDESDEQMQEKLDPYAICLNTLSAPVHATRARYFAWVDPKTGVTGNERVVLGLLALPKDGAKKCAAGLVVAKGLPPKDPKLEAAGDEFAKSVTELDALIGELFPYYETQKYKEDKLAKGKELHPKLVAAFAAFSKADASLHATVAGIGKPLAARTIARIEREDGRKFRFHRKRVLLAGRELVDAGDLSGDEDDIDAAAFKTALAEYDKALTELQGFGVLHKNELDAQSNPAWPQAKANFDQFDRAADAFRKKARDYDRCLEQAPAKAKTDAGKIDPEKLPPCKDGGRTDVVTNYNELVRVANAHQFP